MYLSTTQRFRVISRECVILRHLRYRHIETNTFPIYTRRFTSQWRLYGHSGYVRFSSSSKATFGLEKSPQFDSFYFLNVLGAGRTFIIVAGCSMHVVITLRQLRCIRLNLAQVAKRSHGFASIHPTSEPRHPCSSLDSGSIK